MPVGDFNGDGKSDLVMVLNNVTEMGNTMAILLGDGDGTFQEATSYSVGANPWSLAVGNFNVDRIAPLGGSKPWELYGSGSGQRQSCEERATAPSSRLSTTPERGQPYLRPWVICEAPERLPSMW